MSVKVISFDIGGTLIYFNNQNNLLEKLSVLFQIDAKVLATIIQRKHIVGKESIDSLCNSLRYPDISMVISIIEEHKASTEVVIYEEVVQELRKLCRQGYQLISISNNFSWNQDRRLSFYSLSEYISQEYYSYEIGYAKPDKAIFNHVQRLIGVRSDEILHIGDSFRSDACGASDAGWNGVWLTRIGMTMPQNRQDIKVINDLTQLDTILNI